jgi:hypothetical protein
MTQFPTKMLTHLFCSRFLGKIVYLEFYRVNPMANVINWALGSSEPDNEANLAQIGQWWSGLVGQEIIWKQRAIPENGDASTINWDTKEQFDETFTIQSPSLRGITLYWHKPTSEEERNITVGQVLLDLYNQQLDLLPASGKNYQVRIILPRVVYQTYKLNNPQLASTTLTNGDKVLLLRDEGQRIEVQITLNPVNIELAKQKLL